MSGEKHVKRSFHQAAWNEPIIMTMGRKGRRGVLVPPSGDLLRAEAGDVLSSIPPSLRRVTPPGLPELSQPEVLRHFTRLSQMVMANNVAINLGLGTTTMKYNPPIHEYLIRSPKLADLHPEEDDSAIQGLLEMLWRMGEALQGISGMDRFTFQPAGGSQGIFINSLMIKAYHRARGEADKRTEIITTIFSHPANGAAPATTGFKVVTLYPGPKGYPELDALKAVISDRTAGMMITNPEDTGIFNPHIAEFVRLVQAAGGLCAYDQANANGTLGVTRARDAGFDMCHFNLHKTFAVPHGCMGGAVGAVGVRKELIPYLPLPTIEFDEGQGRYFRDFDRSKSIGTVRGGLGNVHSVMKAYAWVMSMGPDFLREVAHISVLNNNYLAKKIAAIRGASVSFSEGNPARRLEQVRYSWEGLAEETGVNTMHVHNRMIDYGLQGYFTSHHPWLVPEPFSLEPAESYSREDLDEFAAVLEQVSDEAYSNPEVVKTAPHRSTTNSPLLEDAYTRPAMTWKAYLNTRAVTRGVDARSDLE
jgi:glycine dehydrogenase subunit 2